MGRHYPCLFTSESEKLLSAFLEGSHSLEGKLGKSCACLGHAGSNPHGINLSPSWLSLVLSVASCVSASLHPGDGNAGRHMPQRGHGGEGASFRALGRRAGAFPQRVEITAPAKASLALGGPDAPLLSSSCPAAPLPARGSAGLKHSTISPPGTSAHFPGALQSFLLRQRPGPKSLCCGDRPAWI